MTTKKVQKFADGGAPDQLSVGQQRMAADPERQFIDQLRAMRDPIAQARTQYVIGSPERQNYRAYMQSVMPSFKDAREAFSRTGTTTLPKIAAYNPATSYANAPSPGGVPTGGITNFGPGSGGAPMKKGGKVKAMKEGGAAKGWGKARGAKSYKVY